VENITTIYKLNYIKQNTITSIRVTKTRVHLLTQTQKLSKMPCYLKLGFN